MNVWNFTGNLGKEAIVRYTQDGKPIASFSVGVRSGFGDKATTTWANCSLFGKQAESLSPYLTKGQQVAVSGEVNLRDYDTQNGPGKSLDVRVTNIDLIGGKRELSEAREPAKANGSQPGNDLPEDIYDLPF